MITLYNPTTEAFQAYTNGVEGVSDQQMMLNILIEMRATNLILLGQQRGPVTDSLENLRAGVVSDSTNPRT